MAHSILIVDDEPRITAALMMRLERAGYEVFHAINGLAGVEAAAIHQPDLAIMDIRMPDINGFEACQRIRRLPGLAAVPVVFLSANIDSETEDRVLTLGNTAAIRKPYFVDEVIDAISGLLAERSQVERSKPRTAAS